jgi:hypothetical protein
LRWEGGEGTLKGWCRWKEAGCVPLGLMVLFLSAWVHRHRDIRALARRKIVLSTARGIYSTAGEHYLCLLLLTHTWLPNHQIWHLSLQSSISSFSSNQSGKRDQFPDPNLTLSQAGAWEGTTIPKRIACRFQATSRAIEAHQTQSNLHFPAKSINLHIPSKSTW